MKKSISIESELNSISNNYWLLDYDNLYIDLGDNYAIRVVKVKGVVWFEVDQIDIDDISLLTEYFTEWYKHSYAD